MQLSDTEILRAESNNGDKNLGTLKPSAHHLLLFANDNKTTFLRKKKIEFCET